MDRCGGVHRDARVAVPGVVVGEENAAEHVGVLDGPEFAVECGAVFEGLELRL